MTAKIKKPRLTSRVITLILLLHGMLLAWIGYRTSPVLDEIGHLAGGVYSWHFGRFDVYRVNPPLVRCVAALPIVLAFPATDWRGHRNGPGDRPEWQLGRQFMLANGRRSFLYFTIARWACIPFLILGGWICWRWALELYGERAGLIACLLWSFSPTVLGWGPTICPDAAAAALGAAAGYTFWRWLLVPTWDRAFFAGITLGLAELSKTTWVILFIAWPLLTIIWGRLSRGGIVVRLERIAQLTLTFLLSVVVLNTGFAFEGSGMPIEEYEFVSRTLGHSRSLVEGTNRFRGTSLGQVPVILPKNYLCGIDLQKRDFEEKKWCYLRGKWKRGGWWYFYLYAAAVKVPIGIWGLGILAASVGRTMLTHPVTRAMHGQRSASISRTKSLSEITVLVPPAAVLLLVSSQTGFTIYFRYVLPCFPFLFIWMSRLAQHWNTESCLFRYSVTAALVSAVASSLWCFPHNMSYFNELVGGPSQGHRHLVDANIDWGQDFHYLEHWLEKHPSARPLHVECFAFTSEDLLDLGGTKPVPNSPNSASTSPNLAVREDGRGPQPGWYAVSVTTILSRKGDYSFFLEYEPVARVGYSIRVYHISSSEANRVRSERGGTRDGD